MSDEEDESYNDSDKGWFEDLVISIDTTFLLSYCKTDKEEMVMILAERKGEDLYIHLSEKYKDKEEERMDKDIETLSRLYKVEPKQFK